MSDDEFVGQLVLAAHGVIDKVRSLINGRPLVDARWSRFDETALEAASPTGERHMGEFLLDDGAEMTVFATAMLGREQEVRAVLGAEPVAGRDVRGPWEEARGRTERAASAGGALDRGPR